MRVFAVLAISIGLTACGGTGSNQTTFTTYTPPKEQNDSPFPAKSPTVSTPSPTPSPSPTPVATLTPEPTPSPTPMAESGRKMTQLHKQYCGEISTTKLDIEQISLEPYAEIEAISAGWSMLEGPVWHDGELYMSLIGYQTENQDGYQVSIGHLVKLYRREILIEEEEYGSNGLIIDEQDRLIAARHYDGSITTYSTNNQLADRYDGQRFNSPNDLVVSSQGHLYFSDPNYQVSEANIQPKERIYHVNEDGNVRSLSTSMHIDKPNGLVLTLDERQLLVGGKNGLFKFDINDYGRVINGGERIFQNEIPNDADGFTKDCAGNIYLVTKTHLFVISADLSEILVKYDFAMREQDARFAPDSGLEMTNIAFGGADMKTLYVTTMGQNPRVYRTRLNIPGFPY